MNRSSKGGWHTKSIPNRGTGAKHPGKQRKLQQVWWAWRQRCGAQGGQSGCPGYEFILEAVGHHGRVQGKGMTWQICVLERSLWPGWDAVNRVTAFVSPHPESSLQVAFSESKSLLLWEPRVKSTWELPHCTYIPSSWRVVPALSILKSLGDPAAEPSHVFAWPGVPHIDLITFPHLLYISHAATVKILCITL